MATERPDQDGDPSIGGDAAASGQRSDPVATENQDLAQAGGPSAGEPAAVGSQYASRGQQDRREGRPSGERAEASGVPASNEVAPVVRASMDDDVRLTDEKARRIAGPANKDA